MNKEWLRLSIFCICTKTEDRNTTMVAWNPKLEPGQNEELGGRGVHPTQTCWIKKQHWLWKPDMLKALTSVCLRWNWALPTQILTTDSCERNVSVRLCPPLQLTFSTSCSGEPTVSNSARSIMVDKKCTGCPEEEGREASLLPSSERIHSRKGSLVRLIMKPHSCFSCNRVDGRAIKIDIRKLSVSQDYYKMQKKRGTSVVWVLLLRSFPLHWLTQLSK